MSIFRYFKKKAIQIPSCLGTYPQSLSHLRRNRYSNLLQRFSLESHPESMADHTHQDHFLGIGPLPMTVASRQRSSLFFDANTGVTRSVKSGALPLINVPEVIVMDETGARTSKKKHISDIAQIFRKKPSWRDRFGMKESLEKSSKSGCNFPQPSSSCADMSPAGGPPSPANPSNSCRNSLRSSCLSINMYK